MCVWSVLRMLRLISCIPWCSTDRNVSISTFKLCEPRHISSGCLKESIKRDILCSVSQSFGIITPCCIFRSVYQSFLFLPIPVLPARTNFSTASPFLTNRNPFKENVFCTFFFNPCISFKCIWNFFSFYLKSGEMNYGFPFDSVLYQFSDGFPVLRQNKRFLLCIPFSDGTHLSSSIRYPLSERNFRLLSSILSCIVLVFTSNI